MPGLVGLVGCVVLVGLVWLVEFMGFVRVGWLVPFVLLLYLYKNGDY
jgi:hypothetical protein